MTMKQVLEILAKGPASSQELAAQMGICLPQTNRQLRVLRDRKLVRINRYVRQEAPYRGTPTPYYALGKSADVPMPAPLGPEERNKRYRARNALRISVKRYPHHHASKGVWAGLL
jgi:predicted ArsR family transcriptional regulator